MLGEVIYAGCKGYRYRWREAFNPVGEEGRRFEIKQAGLDEPANNP